QSVIHPGGTFHYDAFVTKMNPTITGLIYSTFLGGGNSLKKPPHRDPAGDDYGNAIAVDTDGSAVVVGNTTSVDFAVTDPAFDAKIIPVPTTMTLTVQTSPSALGGQFVDVTLTGFHFVVGNGPLGTIYSVDTFFDGPMMLGHGTDDGKGNSVITIRGVSIATP